MIKLDAPFVTTISRSIGGEEQVTITDTLFVSSVTLDFTTGTLLAVIQRGIGKPFFANMEEMVVKVNADGSFASLDNTWTGAVPAVPGVIASLRASFDQLLLSSGSLTGQIL